MGLSDVLRKYSEVTILEAAELAKPIGEKRGVSDAATAPAPAVAATAVAVAASEEKLKFDVVLAEAGRNKIAVIKTVREVDSVIGLTDAKKLVESAPATILAGVPKDAAEAAKAELEKAGAKVELRTLSPNGQSAAVEEIAGVSVAEQLYEQNKSEMIGNGSLYDYLVELDFESEYFDLDLCNAYYVIIDPDHPRYEDELNNMEQNYSGYSIHGPDTHAGFIDPEGECSRILIFPDSVDVGDWRGEEFMETNNPKFIKKILPNILFDSFLITKTLGIR